jgi:hypothetical protein
VVTVRARVYGVVHLFAMYRKMRLRIGHISYCEFTFPHLVFPSYTLPDVASVAPQFNSSPHIEIHDPRIFLLELMIDPQIGHSAVASGGRAFRNYNYNYPAFFVSRVD